MLLGSILSQNSTIFASSQEEKRSRIMIICTELNPNKCLFKPTSTLALVEEMSDHVTTNLFRRIPVILLPKNKKGSSRKKDHRKTTFERSRRRNTSHSDPRRERKGAARTRRCVVRGPAERVAGRNHLVRGRRLERSSSSARERPRRAETRNNPVPRSLHTL